MSSLHNISDYQHTADHVGCPACNQMREKRSGKLDGEMLFPRAAETWLTARSELPAQGTETARYIRERTETSYWEYKRSLDLFFQGLRLEQIHIGHIRSYQTLRAGGSAPFIRLRRPHEKIPRPSPVAGKKINQELGMLRQLMERAECWTAELELLYEPLLESHASIPRALSPSEQQHWLEASRKKDRWLLIHWYSALAFATTMGTNEMRAERICDLRLGERMAYVSGDGAKNPYRERSIPLVSEAAVEAAGELLARARRLGATEAFHFVFPFRKCPKPFDPTQPMTVGGLARLWGEVRKESGLLWFQPYGTRHTAITRMAESGMDFPMIQAFAGHISARMSRHYIQISNQAKRRALEKMEAQRKPPQSVRPDVRGAIPFR